MGGVQWKRSFDLRPDLLTFPAAALGGSAVVPSAVTLYLNGVRQLETAVPSGPFIINQVAGINGAGQATLVTRDAAGRAVSTTLPLYVDTRMLAAGLTDYSVELGVLRRRYTTASFDYARTPAASASLRRGLSDSLTLEAHAEGGSGVLNGGAGLLWRLGQAGVVSASLAASGGGGWGRRGRQATLGYQYLSPRFSVDLQSQRADAGYSDLGTLEGGPACAPTTASTSTCRWARARAWASAPSACASRCAAGAGAGAVVFGHAGARPVPQRQRLPRPARPKARGVFFSLSGTLGERISATVSRSRQNDVRTTTTTLSRSAVWRRLRLGPASGQHNGATQYQAQGLYLGNYGQVSARMLENNGQRTSAVDVAGALVLMDGGVHAARQVGGFALVSTDGVGGVPVLQENQVIGKTSGSGYMLVPNLNPYFINQIGIDPSSLPLDARIASTGQGVVPARLSGVLVRFPVETYEAASVILHGADGRPLGAGTTCCTWKAATAPWSATTAWRSSTTCSAQPPAPDVDGKPCAIEFATRRQRRRLADAGPVPLPGSAMMRAAG
jgi:outer membrane usher protein